MIASRLLERAVAVAAALFLSLGGAFAQYPGSKYYPLVSGSDVTFLLQADKAQEVRVYGDFLPGVNEYGLGGSEAMTKGPDGVWTYTAHGLAPEFYFYYFEVDGVRVLDPNNLKVVCNYSEFFNSFLVEGPESAAYNYASERKGSVETRWYDSPEYGGQRRLEVYLPYGYSRARAYPVLYMFPGGGDDEDTWIDMGRLPQIMDYLIASGEAVPMIVVMVNAMPNQFAAPHVMNPIPGMKTHFELMGSPEGATGGEFCNDLMHNIIPFVESEYAALHGRDARAVCGVSMGGVYEMYLVEHYPELFGSYAFMGSGITGRRTPGAAGDADNAADAAVLPLVDAGCRLVWIGAGSTDMALSSAQSLMSALDRVGIKYTYYDSGDGHNWRSWRRDLRQLVPLLFR